MQEIWKDIKNYEDKYQISIFGNVKNVKTNKMLTPYKNTNGYFQIDLWIKNKRKKFLIHKLVAETFIPNINNSPIVNHKDENKQNNNINNLEWCTAKYNANYGTRNKKLSKPVVCIELNKQFESLKMAEEELKIEKTNISKCCYKKRHHKTAGGYHWRWA